MSRTRLFSHQAWDRNASIYEVIRTMPFNAQLASGTLSEARFKHYITQDAHYLIGFGRALTLAAAKAPNPDRIVQFAKAAEGARVVERALHGSFFKQYGITPRAASASAAANPMPLVAPVIRICLSFTAQQSKAAQQDTPARVAIPRTLPSVFDRPVWFACAGIATLNPFQMLRGRPIISSDKTQKGEHDSAVGEAGPLQSLSDCHRISQIREVHDDSPQPSRFFGCDCSQCRCSHCRARQGVSCRRDGLDDHVS